MSDSTAHRRFTAAFHAVIEGFAHNHFSMTDAERIKDLAVHYLATRGQQTNTTITPDHSTSVDVALNGHPTNKPEDDNVVESNPGTHNPAQLQTDAPPPAGNAGVHQVEHQPASRVQAPSNAADDAADQPAADKAEHG